MALEAVLRQRVLLPQGAEVDALAQVVHVQQVLAPVDVDQLQQNPALQVAHHVGTQLRFAPVVGIHGVVLKAVEQFLAGERVVPHVVDAEGHRVQLRHLGEHAIQVPVGHRGVLVLVAVHRLHQHLGDPVAGAVGQVGSLQHLPALGVHDLTLLVQHVVVLQHPLADVEVVFLHLLLGALDRLGEHLRVERKVVPRSQAVQHLVHAVAGEDADQVVLGREEEQRAAGVALAP